MGRLVSRVWVPWLSVANQGRRDEHIAPLIENDNAAVPNDGSDDQCQIYGHEDAQQR